MFGGHAPGQGYFGQGPQGGTNPVTVAFRAAYRLYLRIIGPRRTLGVSPERRTLRIAQVRRAIGVSPERRDIGNVGDVRTLGAIS